MKIAVISARRVDADVYNCYEELIPESITDWDEVSEEEYKQLDKFFSKQNRSYLEKVYYILVERLPEPKKLIKDFKEAAKKELEEEKKKKEEAERKRKLKMEKQKKNKEEKELELLQELKNKYES